VSVIGAPGAAQAGVFVEIKNTRTNAFTSVTATSNGSFSANLKNTGVGDKLTLVAVDSDDNNSVAVQVTVMGPQPPPPVNISLVTVTAPGGGNVMVAGAPGATGPGLLVEITNLRTGAYATAWSGPDGSFGNGPFASVGLSAASGDTLSIAALNAPNNRSSTAQMIVPATPPPPAGLALHPTPIDPTVATSVYDSMVFLFTGDNPPQTGVAAGTIEPKRIAILRGLVTGRDGAPIPDVSITIHDHPEYGQTVTRADGMYDVAVNGGGWITVQYKKDNYLPVQRKVDAPWRDWAWAPDVTMIGYDPVVTLVDLTAPGTKVARGSVVTDANGSRQATLMFPEGTTATITLADGTQKQLSTISVRATEYTVGDTGQNAMPAPLPPTSGYTYAVEFTVDEAMADGVRKNGKEVVFNQPAYVYLDNFLNFPAGEIIPVGYYDSDRAMWIPDDNGVALAITAITNGKAEVDVTGDGVAESSAALALIGLTDAERVRLAELYPAGKTLWRAPRRHFSDLNMGRRLLGGAGGPGAPPPPLCCEFRLICKPSG
jgi:hypothetical protein